MAFAVGAAHAPSLDGWLTNGLSPRTDQGAVHILNTRSESTTRNNTVNLFVDSVGDGYEYAASVITACADQTIYAIQCTAGPVGRSILPAGACGPNGVIGRLTAGPSTYDISTETSTTTMGYAVAATVEESCVLGGTTAATCTATVKGAVDGTSVSTAITTILSGTEYHRYDVEITGGAEKTANPTGTCGAKNAAASVNTKTRALWALAGVVGVASVLAMQ